MKLTITNKPTGLSENYEVSNDTKWEEFYGAIANYDGKAIVFKLKNGGCLIIGDGIINQSIIQIGD